MTTACAATCAMRSIPPKDDTFVNTSTRLSFNSQQRTRPLLMNNASIIDQLLKGDLKIETAGLLLALFTLSTIYRVFVKETSSPIAQCLNFFSAQRLMGIINWLLINRAKNRDNKAKIASGKEQLKLDPDNLMLHKNLARLYVEAKSQRLNAFKAYEYVFENDPTEREAFNYLLDHVLKNKQFEQAKSFIDIAEYPDSDIIQSTFGSLVKHNKKIDLKIETAGYYLKGKLMNVKETYIEIIRYSLGLAADFRVVAFSNMIDYLPEYSETFSSLALSYEKLALYPAAANNYRLSAAFFNSADTSSRLGYLLTEHLNQHTEAKACFEKAIELDPNDAVAHKNLGNLLTTHFNLHKEAKASYDKAIELDPNQAVAHNSLGYLLTKHFNQHKEAKACYDKAIELDQNDSVASNNIGKLLNSHF
ncbi:MAG: tetratricopeptide repeat protein, partial [Psychrosphaera sp.]|nr:tetratricopeptide repeat protein [Psychrosphaera sp.]